VSVGILVGQEEKDGGAEREKKTEQTHCALMTETLRPPPTPQIVAGKAITSSTTATVEVAGLGKKQPMKPQRQSDP